MSQQREFAAQPRLPRLIHSISIAGLAGFVAGVIAGGVGSRIAMRVSGIAAGSAKQGFLTEGENPVGEITLSGTVILVGFSGFIGATGGLIYLATRRWVADAGRWSGLAFGVLLLAMLGSSIIEGDNFDFYVFGPRTLNVAMFASLFILFGLLVAPLFERVNRALPAPPLRKRFGVLVLPSDYSLAGLIRLAAQVLGVGVLVPTAILIVTSFDSLVLALLPAYLLFVVPTAAALLARASGGFERLSDLRTHRWAIVAALAVLALPLALGLVLNVQAIAEIYQATSLNVQAIAEIYQATDCPLCHGD